MKARFFDLDASHLPSAHSLPPAGPQSFNVPGLSAYSIIHADLQYNGQTIAIDGDELKINGDNLVSKDSQFSKDDVVIISAYYFGIRDYSLLFPQVKASQPNRADRMGKLYEEAEVAFDGDAWLSFMLMCGAIFEHLLFFKLNCPNGNEKLASLNLAARNQALIDASQFATIDNTRHARNVIHCNQVQNNYISRLEAMDARVLIEKLMLRL